MFITSLTVINTVLYTMLLIIFLADVLIIICLNYSYIMYHRINISLHKCLIITCGKSLVAIGKYN